MSVKIINLNNSVRLWNILFICIADNSKKGRKWSDIARLRKVDYFNKETLHNQGDESGAMNFDLVVPIEAN